MNVPGSSSESDSDEDVVLSQGSTLSQLAGLNSLHQYVHQAPSAQSITRFLTFPEVHLPVSRRQQTQPYVDYSKSIIMTSQDYVQLLQQKSDARDVALVE